MDYATEQQAGCAARAVDRPATQLDQIDSAADTASRIGDLIEQFIARFRGEGRSDSAGIAPVPSGYAGQLSRLESNLKRAEEMAQELRSIG